MSALRQGARTGADRRARRRGPRPRHVLAGVRRGHRRPPVPHYWQAVLVHAGPGVAADHEPLQRRACRSSRRVRSRSSTTGTTSTSSPTSPARARGVSTLHEATGGDPSGSPRWQANMALGGDQELIAATAHAARRRLGRARPLPRAREPMFDADEIGVPARRSPPTWPRARAAALLVGEASDPEGPDAPGLLVLSADWEVESATPGVERWLADLPDGDWDAGALPSAVLAVAGRALRTARGPATRRARSRWRACSRDRARGSSCTAPRSSATAAPRRGDRRAGPPGPHRAAADVGLRPDRARAGGHAARAPGRLDDARSPSGSSSRPTPCSSTSRASSRRPACAAGATSSARCSSPTTSRACATTSGGRSTARCAADR